jgi:hypothetical protein
MSCTSIARSAEFASLRTAAIRARQRSRVSTFARTRSRSITCDPIDERRFGGCSHALQVGVAARQDCGELCERARSGAEEAATVAQDLHREDWRCGSEIHEVHAAAEQPLDVGAGFEQRDDVRRRAEQRREIDVGVRARSAARLGAEDQQRFETEALVEEIDEFTSWAGSSMTLASSPRLRGPATLAAARGSSSGPLYPSAAA